METVWLVALVLLVVFFFVLKGNSSDDGDSPEKPSGWVIGPVIQGINYSVGMPERPNIQDLGWSLRFPGPEGKVGYVQWLGPPTMYGAKKLVINYSVTGGGFVAAKSEPIAPGTVGIQIQHKGDDWSAVGPMQSHRWYSRNRPILVVGDNQTLEVPLDILEWIDVYGKSENQVLFDETLSDPENIAIVFGGGSFAAHGVYATQPSTFILHSMVIEL